MLSDRWFEVQLAPLLLEFPLLFHVVFLPSVVLFLSRWLLRGIRFGRNFASVSRQTRSVRSDSQAQILAQIKLRLAHAQVSPRPDPPRLAQIHPD